MKRNWIFAPTLLLAALLLPRFIVAAPFGEFRTTLIDGAAGSSRASNGGIQLNSSAPNNGVVFVSQPFSGNGEISAQIRRTAQNPKVGILFRQNTNAASVSAGMFLAATHTNFERQLATNEPTVVTIRTNETWEWLRVVREGSSFGGFISADGKNWTQISADTIEMPENIFAGFAISEIGEAEIENVRLSSARLVNPSAKSHFTAPTNVFVEAAVESLGGEIKRVEFFAGAEKLKEFHTPPYAFLWTNILAGDYPITAKITGENGGEFFTEPINVEIKLLPSFAKFLGANAKTQGNWKGQFGENGYLIANDKTNLPDGIQFEAENIWPFTWADTGVTEARALQRAELPGRLISSWNHRRPIQLKLSLADGSQQRFSLYFLDCDKKDRTMDIQIWDASGKLLDRQTVGSFTEGKYLTWLLRGKVVIRISSVGPSNPIVSAMFFDPAP